MNEERSMNTKLTAERLERGAMVYIRQSTAAQVMHHQEGRRRQYALEEHARHMGFERVTVIDEDLGRSGSGLVERSGFEQLLGAVCAYAVGAVFCLEASRLARNGREWHHLIELCGMTGTVIVDPDGVYDPSQVNDRLLLGVKGTMSEFELTLLRERAAEAILEKARRGELQFALPVGYVWTADGKMEKEPDLRVQQTIALIFSKMTELGSVRQVMLWFRGEGLTLPRKNQDQPGGGIIWAPAVYSVLLSMFSNPIYSGAYAFGRTKSQTKIIEGRVRKTAGHKKPRAEWTVLIPNHHPGYISWEEYERNQAKMAANIQMKTRMEPKAGRGGRALLSGLLRCRRCGRMLYVSYSGEAGKVLRYVCRGAHMRDGGERCLSFSGVRVDRAVGEEVLHAVSGNAIEAAVEAADKMREQHQEQRRAMEMELEQARYQSKLAARRYEAVDPDNRMVAAELEGRWNAALQKVQGLEDGLRNFDEAGKRPAIPDKETLLSLAQDLPAVWNSASTEAGLKQRIVHILVEEVVVDVDEEKHQIVLLIHWAGGRHSELRVSKTSTGQHGRTTAMDAIDVVRQMSGKYDDGEIAATLNRLSLRTGVGNSWTAQRVYSLRRKHDLPNFVGKAAHGIVTLQQAANQLSISEVSVRRLIEQKVLPATQVVPSAPWEISLDALKSPPVQQAINRLRNHKRPPSAIDQTADLLFS
jgi:DNA invertase Pin-like site-specific DNA recombinase